MSQLLDKVAIITGGNSGIGFAAAQEFLTKGARVLITGRKKDAVDQAVAALGTNAAGFLADQRSLEDADKLAAHVKAQYGKVDILFVNAGVAVLGAFAETTEAQFDEGMDINFKGAFFTVQKLLPLLKDGGSIIFLSSINAATGMAGTAVYSASKAAMNSLTRVLSRELAGRKIRVNAVNPGPITTPILEKAGLSDEAAAGFREQISKAVPLQRMGDAGEVAKLVAFLASDDSRYISGTEVAIDGGLTVHPQM